MAKAAAPEIDKSELKKLLTRSKKEPVNCAIGLAADGSAVIMLDKIKQPRAVLKKMEDEYGDIKNGRWGTAEVDTDVDPKLVVLTINKTASGIARKLKKTLKGTTFTKVRVMLEGGGVDEEDMEDEEQDAAAAPAAGPARAEAGDAAAPASAAPEAPVAASEPQPRAAPATAAAPAAPAGVDFRALTAALTDLVRKMIPIRANDSDRFAQLKAMADRASAAIKTSSDEAVELIAELGAAIEGGSDAAAPAAAAPGAAAAAPAAVPAEGAAQVGAPHVLPPEKKAALAAGPKLWDDAVSSINNALERLQDTIRKEFETEAPEVVADIERNLNKITDVTKQFESKLADYLREAHDATDAASHNAAIRNAKAAMGEHMKYVASDPMIKLLDENPFGVPTDIKKTMADNLKKLVDAVR